MIIYAAINGYLDDIELNRISRFEQEFYRFLDQHRPQLAEEINKTGQLSDETEAALKQAIQEFKEQFVA